VYRLVAEQRVELKAQPDLLEPATLEGPHKALYQKLHQTIKKVTEDLEALRFNTAIAALMELLNALGDYRKEHGVTPVFREAVLRYIQMLAPFAPHLAEELWHEFYTDSVFKAPWPRLDESALVADSFELVVQVNGKLRGKATISTQASEEEIKRTARELPNVQQHIAGKEVVKEIYVPGKLLNIVVKG
jgi:leucyl-tRNA synthetase